MKITEKRELFEYFLEGAEFGSTWLEIKTLKKEDALDAEFSEDYLESRCFPTKAYDRLVSGGHIVCVDWYSAEDNENGRPDKYKLSLKDIEERLNKAMCDESIARTYWEVFSEDGCPDYYDYNNLMQYIMFGEVVYG